MPRRQVSTLPFYALSIGLLAARVGAQEVPKTDPAPRADAEPRVTLEADSEPLLAVLKKICGQQGLNFVASEAALEKAGKVSLRLRDVTLEEALESICEVEGLEARVRGKIVVVKVREADRRERERPDPQPRGKDNFLPDPAPRAGPAKPAAGSQAPRSAPTPGAPDPQTPPVADVSSPAVTTRPASHMAAGVVVEVGADSLKVKESSGDPRSFSLPADDPDRSSRLAPALKRIKRGDRIALEYRVEGDRLVVTNLVAGGKPQ